MYETASQVKKDRPSSRIESDIELIKTLTNHVENTTVRVVRHAHSLGYFQPPEKAEASAPTPVVTTMADALQALSRAIDHCSGSLNVFDWYQKALRLRGASLAGWACSPI